MTGAMLVAELFRRAPDTDSEEELWLGCPMLKKVTFQTKRGRKRVILRCALGYALNTPEAVERCRATAGPHQCWQCQEYLAARTLREPS
ncbi:MAG: hypothetical protein J7450_00720 [Thermomicrobium sp.]|uniref:hypothetical protein n=1 Tax=Thermomicrobium sp. TaxID=1969469 RepID=UPI001B2633BD|nr:hypothetical protein [Thermomicrobium sp.]MBO9358068.1 hypothetical protein [Thermomicrobium sp.]